MQVLQAALVQMPVMNGKQTKPVESTGVSESPLKTLSDRSGSAAWLCHWEFHGNVCETNTTDCSVQFVQFFIGETCRKDGVWCNKKGSSGSLITSS